MSIDTGTQLDLVDQYADVLDLNWRRRCHLMRSHVVNFSALVNWDERIRISMTALKELDACARPQLRRRLNEPLLAGELFSIGLYGFLVNDTDLIQATNAIARSLPHLNAAWFAAMQWAPSSDCLQQTIGHLAVDQQMEILASRRGNAAKSTIQIQHLFERANAAPMNLETIRAALTLVRVMADKTRLSVANYFLSHEHAGVRLDAARAVLVLGSGRDQRHSSFDVLISLVEGEDFVLRELAIQSLALHWDDPQVVRTKVTTVLQRLADRCPHSDERYELARLYLRMLGWLGQVDGIEVLVHNLNGPHRRTAAASLSLITGSDPLRDGWQGQAAESLQIHADSDNDHIPSIHAEHGMLWPDKTGFERWWTQNAERFDAKRRYFAGNSLTAGMLEQAYWQSPLAWRPWIAEHLQRLTHQAMMPWDAPAWLQKGSNASLKESIYVQ
jgi:hypothetical protein